MKKFDLEEYIENRKQFFEAEAERYKPHTPDACKHIRCTSMADAFSEVLEIMKEIKK